VEVAPRISFAKQFGFQFGFLKQTAHVAQREN